MNNSLKKRIFELLDTISEMTKVLQKVQNKKEALSDCIAAVESIINQLKKEEHLPLKTIDIVNELLNNFNVAYNQNEIIDKNYIRIILNKIKSAKNEIKEEVHIELNIVFFPYKASMWDSMATIYEAAQRDPNCNAKVVPVPYYELEQYSENEIYEGNLFPDNIPIIHYSEYFFEEEEPDVIYVHNVYDQYNSITRIAERFFTSNLKKYTDMLVYVPYHISSPIEFSSQMARVAYSIPTMKYVDKVVLAGKFVEQEALRAGIPKNKILTLGSPKFDGMYNALNTDIAIPNEWKKTIDGKIVFLLNTGCMDFISDTRGMSIIMDLIFDIPRYVEGIAIIWRPHPLTKTAVKQYLPQFSYALDNYYNVVKNKNPHAINIIVDETPNYYPALKVADVLISNFSSLLDSYLLTEKKVIFLGERMPENSLIPHNAFYYFFDSKDPWFELAKKFVKGYDPLAENRKSLANRFFECVDGTSGEKIYNAVKNSIIRE